MSIVIVGGLYVESGLLTALSTHLTSLFSPGSRYRYKIRPFLQGQRRRTVYTNSDSRFTEQNSISGSSVVFISTPLCRTHIR